MPQPPQVGSRAGAPAVGGGFPALLLRLQDGCTVPPWPRFQPPPRQTQRAAFPHCAFLLASHQGLWDLSCWERFQPWAVHPVVVKQAQALLQPLPTPPLPTEAPPCPCTPQMPSHLLFHPIFDKTDIPHRGPDFGEFLSVKPFIPLAQELEEVLVLVGQIQHHEALPRDVQHMNPNEVVKHPACRWSLATLALLVWKRRAVLLERAADAVL